MTKKLINNKIIPFPRYELKTFKENNKDFYDFKREDIEEMFNVKKSRASEIIALLLDSDLVESSHPTKYKFKK